MKELEIKILDLYVNTDMLIKDIAITLNINRCTVYDIINRHDIRRSVEHKSRSIANNRRPMSENEKQKRLQKYKQTCLSRYGVDNISKLPSTQQKIANTNLQKYGNKVGGNTVQGRQKAKTTWLNKYGTDNPMKNETIKNKAQATMFIKYGNKVYSKTKRWHKQFDKDKMLSKMRQTNISRYGVFYSTQNKQIAMKGHITKKKNKSYGKSRCEVLLECDLLKNDINFIKQYIEQGIIFDFKINNLYVELNGKFYHNNRPFKDTNKDIEEYNNLCIKGGVFKTIADTWRYRDVSKINYCRQHNINFVAVYYTTYKDSMLNDIINLQDKGINILSYDKGSTTIENVGYEKYVTEEVSRVEIK